MDRLLNTNKSTSEFSQKRKEKTILAQHFEEELISMIGTPYKRGISDCSGIFKTVMRELDIVDDSFDGSSTEIMHRFTIDKRNVSEARAGDFFYWNPKRTP